MTQAAISAGDEVFVTYGELSDAQLLHTYGFIEAHVSNKRSIHPNQHDCFFLPASEVEDVASQGLSGEELALFKQKIRILADNGHFPENAGYTLDR